MKLGRKNGTNGFPTADQQIAAAVASLHLPPAHHTAIRSRPAAAVPDYPVPDPPMPPPADTEVQEVLARVNFVQRNFPMPWPRDVGEKWAADRNWLAVKGIEPPPLPEPVQQVFEQVQNTIATADKPWNTETFRQVEADQRLLQQNGIPVPPLPHQVTDPPRPPDPAPAAPPTPVEAAGTGQTPAAQADWADPFAELEDEFDNEDEEAVAPSHTRTNSGVRRVVRRILGLDRSSKPTDTDWLTDNLEEPALPAPQAASNPARISGGAPKKGPAQTAAATQEATAAGRRARPDLAKAAATESVVVSDAGPAWPARVGKIALWVVIGLIFIAGVNQVILRPIFGTGDSEVTPQSAAIDQSAAQAAAIRYALDYFSYSPESAAAGTVALQADVDSTAIKRWSGTGYLASDSAVAGPMLSIDPTTAIVPVTLRIRLAMPPAGDADRTTPAASPQPTSDNSEASASTPEPSTEQTSAAGTDPAIPDAAAGDPGQIPSGWTDLGSRWVTVSVPVRANSDGGVKATGGGAILVGESDVKGAIGPGEAMTDSDLSNTTRSAVERFFTGYAASDTSYVSAPGIDLSGLNEVVVTTDDPTRWSANQPADAKNATTSATAVTQLTGTATVTWQLTDTDLTIVQTYHASMTLSEGRWYVAQLAPSFTNQ